MYFVDRSVVEHFQYIRYIRYEPHKVFFFFEFVPRPLFIPPLMMCLGFEKNRDVPGFSLNFSRDETRDRLDGEKSDGPADVEGFVRSDVRDFLENLG